jgi:hypothetical protein
VSTPAGGAPLLGAAALAPGVAVSGVRPGEEVAAAGSHVLLSEMLKARISGED